MTSTTSLPPIPGRPMGQRQKRRAITPAGVRRRNRRVEAYRQLVRPVALHYALRCPESAEDLIQVGLLGLIRAAELYRPEQGTPFEAFARPHIRGAILHYLRDLAPSVRLPRRQAELQERLQKLSRQDGASEGTLRARLGIEEGQWRLLLQHRRLCRPLPLEEMGVEELAAPPEERQEEGLLPVAELLARLEARQRLVVRQVVLAGWSYRRLAGQMQVSPMTVQRLLHRGLASLRHQLEQASIRRDPPAHRDGSGLPGC